MQAAKKIAQDILREYRASGGRAGTGAKKRRPKSHYKKLGEIHRANAAARAKLK